MITSKCGGYLYVSKVESICCHVEGAVEAGRPMVDSFLELLAHQLRPAVLSQPRVTQPLIRDVLSLKPLIVLDSLQCSQK